MSYNMNFSNNQKKIPMSVSSNDQTFGVKMSPGGTGGNGAPGEDGLSTYLVENPNGYLQIMPSTITIPDGRELQIGDLLLDRSTGNVYRVYGMVDPSVSAYCILLTQEGCLRGKKGEPGAAAGFGTPLAAVSNTTGTPKVTVSSMGPDTAKVFAFEFSGLKGEPGATPQKGKDYYTDADKAEMVNAVIDALPKYNGEVIEV